MLGCRGRRGIHASSATRSTTCTIPRTTSSSPLAAWSVPGPSAYYLLPYVFKIIEDIFGSSKEMDPCHRQAQVR